jgi:hypothetical protein
MPLMNVLSVQTRPDRWQHYEELVQRLAEAAVARKEENHWTAHQTAIGEIGAIHFASSNGDFAEIAARGTVAEMVERVLGSAEAEKFRAEVSDCLITQQSSISVDRPELSYPPTEEGRTFPAAVLTVLEARPGKQEACEEVIRKVAEAIPKVDDKARLMTFQTVVGNLSEYWTVRPLTDLSELDDQRTPQELLIQAFGPAEGGLIYRSGLDAMTRLQRSILVYRPDMSNPE